MPADDQAIATFMLLQPVIAEALMTALLYMADSGCCIRFWRGESPAEYQTYTKSYRMSKCKDPACKAYLHEPDEVKLPIKVQVDCMLCNTCQAS